MITLGPSPESTEPPGKATEPAIVDYDHLEYVFQDIKAPWWFARAVEPVTSVSARHARFTDT